MLRWISQTLAVSALSVRTIPQRLGSSGVAVVGIAGVVIVFVAVLSIAEGFRAALADAGSPDHAIVMRAGADSEMTSTLVARRPTSSRTLPASSAPVGAPSPRPSST
jgi:putative ABC transport system permease protein